MNILIITLPDDIHSMAVSQVLRDWGHQVLCMSWSDFPQLVSLSCQPQLPGAPFVFRHQGAGVTWSHIDVVWNHRTLEAQPHPQVASADHPPIAQSARILHQGMLQLLAGQSFMVNLPLAKQMYDNKLFQLRTLQQSGFTVPATLVSNDAAEIHRFIRQQQGCVVKPLKFMKWDCGDHNETLYTTELDDISQYHPLAIAACPMIYQEKISKLYELRVVVFGREIVTFRIDSQQAAISSVDWRVPSYVELVVAMQQTPDEIRSQINDFMDRTGFSYGSFDYAVTPEGRYVCFEFNETGQFLWLEQLCPAVPLLDMFCRFLQSRDIRFRYPQVSQPVRLADVAADVAALRQNWREQHVEVQCDKRFKEHQA